SDWPDQNTFSNRVARRLSVPNASHLLMMIVQDQSEAISRITITAFTTGSARRKTEMIESRVAPISGSVPVGVTSTFVVGAAAGASRLWVSLTAPPVGAADGARWAEAGAAKLNATIANATATTRNTFIRNLFQRGPTPGRGAYRSPRFDRPAKVIQRWPNLG